MMKVSNMENKPTVRGHAWAYFPVRLTLLPFGLTKYVYKHGDVAEPPGRLLKVHGLLMMAVVSYFGIQQVLNNISKKHGSMPVISYVIDILVVTSTMLTAVVNIGYSIFRSRKFCRVVNSFADIDQRLEINKNRFYTTIRVKNFIIILLVTAFILGYYLYEASLDIQRDERLNLHFAHLQDAFTTYQMFDFILILWMHVKRFRVLNALLLKFLSEVPDGDPPKEFNSNVFSVQHIHKFSSVKDKEYKKERYDRLIELMRIFDKLADNIYIINCNYGVSLLFTSITTFGTILQTMNGLILFQHVYASEADYSRVLVILWSLPLLVIILIGTYVAEELKSQVDNLSVTLDKLNILPTIDNEQQDLIVCFSQMLIGRNVFITADNFFKFDFSFLFSLIGAIATYTVILMQVNYTPTLSTNSTESLINATNISNIH